MTLHSRAGLGVQVSVDFANRRTEDEALLAWVNPHDVPNVRVGREDLAERIRQQGELRGRIDLAEEFLHDGRARIREAQEFIVVSILVPAAKSQTKAVIFQRQIPSPIFRDYLFGLDALLRQLFSQVFCETLTPQPRIDLFLFSLVRRKLRRAKFNLGFQGIRHRDNRSRRQQRVRNGNENEATRAFDESSAHREEPVAGPVSNNYTLANDAFPSGRAAVNWRVIWGSRALDFLR